MLLKLTTMFLIAATARQEQITKNASQWIYNDGPNKGYLCAVMETDGTKMDVYLPAIWPVAAGKPGAAQALLPVQWLHYANAKDALDAVSAYCPTSTSQLSNLD